MKQLGGGIGVCGIWLGTAYALANGAPGEIVIGSAIGTIAMAFAMAFSNE